MRKHAIFCGLLLLLTTVNAQAANTDGCQLKRFSTLPIETLRDGRIAVPFTVENHPLSFLVDTGGTSITINLDVARQFNHPFQQTSRKLIGVNGATMESYITVNSLALGGMTGQNLPISLETRPLDTTDGTLSPDILKGYDVDIDFARSQLNLFSQDHCRGKVVYWTRTGYVVVLMDVTREGHIRIPVMVDGKKIMATVDTGAVRSLMSLRTAADLGITEKTPALKQVGSADGNTFYSYPFQSLDFGGISVSNPHIDIASDNFTKGLSDDMILGVGILRRLHLYIAYDEEKLYITPALAN
jgi:predicted aspartyl protease